MPYIIICSCSNDHVRSWRNLPQCSGRLPFKSNKTIEIRAVFQEARKKNIWRIIQPLPEENSALITILTSAESTNSLYQSTLKFNLDCLLRELRNYDRTYVFSPDNVIEQGIRGVDCSPRIRQVVNLVRVGVDCENTGRPGRNPLHTTGDMIPYSARHLSNLIYIFIHGNCDKSWACTNNICAVDKLHLTELPNQIRSNLSDCRFLRKDWVSVYPSFNTTIVVLFEFSNCCCNFGYSKFLLTVRKNARHSFFDLFSFRFLLMWLVL